MPKKTFVIASKDTGVRLDKLIVINTGLGRAAVRRLFEEGRVQAHGRRITKGDALLQGTQVTLDLPELSDAAAATPEPHPMHPLHILLERDDVVVVNKPAGQPSAPLRGGELGAVANALVARYPEMQNIGFAPREPGLIHRLDNDTSGVLVAARTPVAFETLVAGLKQSMLEKRYLVVCEDHELPDQGEIEIPLAPHPKDQRRVLACLHPRDVDRLEPRPASTSYVVQKRTSTGFALVGVQAAKALRHQIRAHFAAIGCPVVGDTLYGARPREGLGRHALHAVSVAWRGDAAVAPFAARAELPAELAALLEP